MSMNFNAYDSRTIVIHKTIIMKQTLMYIWQAFVSFSASDIVSWPSISFVLRHKYDASAREDVVVVFFATSSFLVIAYMMQCIQLGHSSTSTTCMKSTKCLNKLMVGGGRFPNISWKLAKSLLGIRTLYSVSYGYYRMCTWPLLYTNLSVTHNAVAFISI